MTGSLSALPSLPLITRRLPRIFPAGLDHRNYFIREIAAKTIFTMFYLGAVEGTGRWIRPNQVVRMNDSQAKKTDEQDRLAWAAQSMRRERDNPSRWFADNSRESIRDETIRDAFVPVGAVVERLGLATTSSAPRYALAADFAELFLATEAEFAAAAERWASDHLTAGARARIEFIRRGVAAKAAPEGVLVRFPNGETRRMSAGESSEITRSVIEEFARRFLENPGVIWVSESSNKVVSRDDELAQRVGLNIDAQRVLPDIILVDVAPKQPVLVFVEVVWSDGPVTEKRKENLLALAKAGGHSAQNTAFVTAYQDRGHPAYRKTGGSLAWGSFAWFASEPDHLVVFQSGEHGPAPLSRFLALQ